MIGIIGAMEAEVKALKAALTHPETQTVGGIEFARGDLGGTPVVIARCGIGKVFAAMCAQAMIVTYAPDLILNTGVAGSLCADLGLLDVAVADSVVQHDFDLSAFGDPVGMLPAINRVDLPAHPDAVSALTETAQDLGYPVRVGVIASGDRFLSDQADKNHLHEAFGAIACEMEGAAIGQVCYANGVPFGILRVISDSSEGDGAMEYAAFMERAAARCCRIVTAFCKENRYE